MPHLELKATHRALLEELLHRHVPQAEVWAFGSRVNGHGHDASDLDLVVRNPLDLAEPTPNLGALREALTQSPLPILVDVQDWATLPVSFRQQILQAYCVIQRGSGLG